jgi:hypothetical protein
MEMNMYRVNLDRIEMFQRVVDFYPLNASLFDSSTVAPEAFRNLGAAFSKASEAARLQAENQKEFRLQSQARAEARDALVKEIQRISNTASAMSVSNPAMAGRFPAPWSITHTRALLNHAETFVANAEPLKSDFGRFGLPEDFIDSLKAAIGRFKAAMQLQAKTKDQRVDSTKALTEALADCQKQLRIIDAVVENTLSGNLPAMAAWNVRRHVATRGKRKTGAKEKSTTTEN